MRFRLRTLLIVLALGPMALVGCDSGEPNFIPPDANAALESLPTFELLSLDPLQPEEEGDDRFHAWKVLGRTLITDKQARTKLVAALRKSVPIYDGPKADCFWPRHGIRVRDALIAYDFVICFECHAADVYANGKRLGGFQTGHAKPLPQPIFDQELVRADVPLPKKATD